MGECGRNFMVRPLDLAKHVVSTTLGYSVNFLGCTRKIGHTHRISFIDDWMQLFGTGVELSFVHSTYIIIKYRHIFEYGTDPQDHQCGVCWCTERRSFHFLHCPHYSCPSVRRSSSHRRHPHSRRHHRPPGLLRYDCLLLPASSSARMRHVTTGRLCCCCCGS